MSEPRPRRDHLRALFAAWWAFFFICAGAPGFDSMRPGTGSDAELQERIIERSGPVLGGVIIRLGWLNDTFRLPVTRRLNWIERKLRIRQSWTLYGGGPRRVKRLHVYADDALLYRTGDRDHQWGAMWMGHRKVRSMEQSLINGDRSPAWRGLGRTLVRKVVEERPATQEVRLVVTWQDFYLGEPRVVHGRTAAPPDWALEPLETTP